MAFALPSPNHGQTPRGIMQLPALLIGLLIAIQGLVGLAAPALFVLVVGFLQAPPGLYFAAVIRVLFGVVLVLAAPGSRAPKMLGALGVLITIGGLLTPFFGVQIAKAILSWWSAGGPAMVRIWAAAAVLIGAFIVIAVAPDRRRT
jgi:hypothetical protein